MNFVIISIFTPMFILGEGLCALVSAFLMNNVLRVCSYDPDAPAEAEDAATDIDSEDGVAA